MVYKILEYPLIHDFVQKCLAMGRIKAVRRTEEFIKNSSKGRVLDIGCGTGRYTHLFRNNYIGLDINVKYLNIEKLKGKDAICGSAVNLPFKNNLFDTVFSVGFFHHIDPIDAEKVFKEILRISKPNAVILLVDVFCPDNKYDLLGQVVMRLDRGKYIKCKRYFMNELEQYFNIVQMSKINFSYPYNLNAFVLGRKNS